MITRSDTVRRLAAIAVLLVSSGAVSASAQTAEPAPRWDAWLGCWQASQPSSPTPAAVPMASEPIVCVTRTNAASAVELSTFQSGKVVARDTIDASGQARSVSIDGCTGSKRAQWSTDGRRVYLQSELTCPGDLKRTTTGMLAIAPTGEWLDAQSVSAGGNTGVRVTRYHEASTARTDSLPAAVRADAGRQLALATARRAAGGSLNVRDIAEAVRLVDTSVVQAWIVERGAKFELEAKHLVTLAAAGVPGSVTDVMIGVSYPEHFALRERPALGIADGAELSPMDSARLVSRYLSNRCYGMLDPLWYSPGLYDPCGSRYGYRGYGYGMYGYGGYGYYGYNAYGRGYLPYGYGYGSGYGYYGAPVVVVKGEEQTHGKLIKGVGYTDGGSRSSGGSSSARTGSSSQGSGSSGGSTSSGSSGSSGSSSGGSSGGRTAVAKPPR